MPEICGQTGNDEEDGIQSQSTKHLCVQRDIDSQ